MKNISCLGLLVLLCVGCAEETTRRGDGGDAGCPSCPDAGDPDTFDDVAPLEAPEPGEPPARPEGTPVEACPSGVVDERYGLCAPTEPASPVLAPDGGCPGETSEEGVCAPVVVWADANVSEEVPEACPAGTMPQSGARCVRVGVACPEGDDPWHAEAALRDRASGYEGGVLYVHAGADVGVEADGSRERPFAQIGLALDAAGDGDIVAVGVGRYDEALSVTRRVAVVGACVEGTSVVGPEGDEQIATVRLLNPDGALVSDVRVSGDRVGVGVGSAIQGRVVQSVWVDRAVGRGVLIASSRPVELADVLVSDTQVGAGSDAVSGLSVVGRGPVEVRRAALVRNLGVGVEVSGDGAQVTVRDLVVSDSLPPSPDGGVGLGVLVLDGASATLERALMTRNNNMGVYASGAGSQVTARDLIISDTAAASSSDGAGYGVFVVSGASVTLEQALVTRSVEAGVYIADAGSRLTARDLVVTDTTPRERDGTSGRAVQVAEGASATLERVLVARNHTASLHVTGAGSRLTARDLVVSDTAPRRSDQVAGRGLVVGGGASAQLERAALVRNHDVNVLSSGANALVTLSDVILADAQPRPTDQGGGFGAFVAQGASLELTRGVVARNHSVGVFVNGQGARFTARDVVFSDMVSGRGLDVEGGAVALLERAALKRNREVGVFVTGEGTGVTMADVVIADTQPRQRDQLGGSGVFAFGGASLTLTRGVVERNHGIGVGVFDEGAEVMMTDVVVADTRPDPSTGTLGVGLSVSGASGVVERLVVTRSHGTGILVGSAGALTARDVVVSDTQPLQVDTTAGYGLQTVTDASLELTRAVFERNHGVGVFVTEGSHATLTDVTILDTLAEEELGGGLAVTTGASAEVRRLASLNNRDFGVLVTDEGTSFIMTDVVIADTQPGGVALAGGGLYVSDAASAEVSRATLARNHVLGAYANGAGTRLTLTDVTISEIKTVAEVGGSGVVSRGEAHVELERFDVSGCTLAGVRLIKQGTIDASEGRVVRNFIGLNTQDADANLDEAFTRVDIRDNCCGGPCEVQSCNIDTSQLPLPSTDEAFDVLKP